MITEGGSNEQLLIKQCFDIKHFNPNSLDSSTCSRGLSWIFAPPKGRFHICAGVFGINSSPKLPWQKSTTQIINQRNQCYCLIKHLMSRKGHSSRSKSMKTPWWLRRQAELIHGFTSASTASLTKSFTHKHTQHILTATLNGQSVLTEQKCPHSVSWMHTLVFSM